MYPDSASLELRAASLTPTSHSTTRFLPDEAAACSRVLPFRSDTLAGCEQIPTATNLGGREEKKKYKLGEVIRVNRFTFL